MTVEVGIVGAAGRMGQMLIQAVEQREDARVSAAAEHPKSEAVGRDAGSVAGLNPLGVKIANDAASVFKNSQVVIDFTLPEATVYNLQQAVETGTALVIGTTGFDAAGKARIEEAARKVPIVFAPNFSVGVNLMFKVAAEVAQVLEENFDIEIIEAHHRNKVDAPSGTAIGLGDAIAEAIGRSLPEVAIYGREGHTGARDRQTIGFSTIRGGDIVGDHTALFAGEGERIEITHRASSRMTFASGAVRAALWVLGKEPKLYDMRDILNFR
ncbi:MAG: 4-hydroxy-tetrahydrodipicolinate reductase [Magnetococcales bacterium]|nr:4-hydroxy-tetrahydrodipicolinate reductase [Magnetococcales bacterium]